MSRGFCMAVWLVASLSMAAPAQRGALVVKAPELVSEAQVAAARRALGTQLSLLDGDGVRNALERAELPEAAARAELERAHQAMRLFELEKVSKALETARQVLEHAEYSDARRDVEVEIALRAAELSVLTKDATGFEHELGNALSLRPNLRLDADRYAPRLLAELERLRAQRERARRVTVRVESVPVGAGVWAAGESHCCTPLTMEVPSGALVLWLQLPEHRAEVRREQISSATELAVELAPFTSSERLRAAVAAVREASGENERARARALGAQLGVDTVAVLDDPRDAPRLFSEPIPAAVLREPPAPPAQRPRTWARRHWPSLLAVGVAAGLGVAGAVLGTRAVAAERRSGASSYASTGASDAAEADREGRTANYLFGAAGGAVLVGGGLYFVF